MPESETKWAKIVDEYEISSSGYMRRPNKQGPGYFYLTPSLQLMYTYHVNGKPTCQSANTIMKRLFGEEFTPLTQKRILKLREEVKKLNQLNSFSGWPRKKREFLGPDAPLNPPRKCHREGCNNLTYDYWCSEECKPKPIADAWDHPDDWYKAGEY